MGYMPGNGQAMPVFPTRTPPPPPYPEAVASVPMDMLIGPFQQHSISQSQVKVPGPAFAELLPHNVEATSGELDQMQGYTDFKRGQSSQYSSGDHT